MATLLRALIVWLAEQGAIMGATAMFTKAFSYLKSVVVAGLKRSLLALVNKEVDEAQAKLDAEIDALRDKLKAEIATKGPGIIDTVFAEAKARIDKQIDDLQAAVLAKF